MGHWNDEGLLLEMLKGEDYRTLTRWVRRSAERSGRRRSSGDGMRTPRDGRRQSQEPPDPKVGTSATCRMMGQRN